MKLFREPLVHFFLAGVALFALFSLWNDEPAQGKVNEITVSVQDARWLAGQFQATWKRPPSPEELDKLLDEFVREEMYVREALALGLDQGDAVVRRRLSQKMEFLSEAGAEAAVTDESALRQFYRDNAQEFAQPPRISFRQIFLKGGEGATPLVLDALDAGTPPEELGVATLLSATMTLAIRQGVDGTFGDGFFDQISKLEPGSWTGPVSSSYGAHVVYLETVEPGVVPPFENVRDRVELMWRSAQAAELRLAFFQALRERYVIARPDPKEVLN